MSLVAAVVALSVAASHRHAPGWSVGLRAADDVSSNHSSFTYVPGQQGVAVSGRQYRRGAPGILTLSVYGMAPPAGSSAATIYVDLSNDTPATALFAAGPIVDITVTQDGKPFQQLTVAQPGIRSLDPAGALMLQASLPLSEAGTYGLSAALVGQGNRPAFTFTNPAGGR
jgi:hypothetical protein